MIVGVSNMNLHRTILIFFSVVLPIFLLLLSYQATLLFYPLTPAQENIFQFLNGKEELSLDYATAEISHLKDVAKVMDGASISLYLSGIIILVILLYYKENKIKLQKIVRYGGIATIIFIALILMAILIGFETVFTVFHHLFFPQGNWQFAADSLLIQTFPIEFFITVSIMIFSLTFILGSLFIVLSFYLKHADQTRGD